MHQAGRDGIGMMSAPFADRYHAGRRLASALTSYAGRPNLLVLALPRGGVPVGYEVARALNAPLDIMLVRKLCVPGHEELAMGAIASNGVRILSDDIVKPWEFQTVPLRPSQPTRNTSWLAARRPIGTTVRLRT